MCAVRRQRGYCGLEPMRIDQWNQSWRMVLAANLTVKSTHLWGVSIHSALWKELSDSHTLQATTFFPNVLSSSFPFPILGTSCVVTIYLLPFKSLLKSFKHLSSEKNFLWDVFTHSKLLLAHLHFHFLSLDPFLTYYRGDPKCLTGFNIQFLSRDF